MFLILQF